MVSRPALVGFFIVTAILLVLGGRALPVIGDAGDSRILWYGGCALGTLAAQMATPRGLMWDPWLRRVTTHKLIIWSALVLFASASTYAAVIAIHGAPWPNAMGIFLGCWAIALTLWRRGFDLAAPLIPFILVVALQIAGVATPALDGIIDSRCGMLILTFGSVMAIAALAVQPKRAAS